jgi:hypothetical protein
MTETILFVDKDTDLMKSTFVAYGLGNLLYQLDKANTKLEVRLEDMGSAYRLWVNRSREALVAYVRTHGLPVLIPAILKPPSDSEKKQLEKGVSEEEVFRRYKPAGFLPDNVVDYGAAKEKAKVKPAKNKPREEVDPSQRPPDYPLWAHLCSHFGKGSAMRKGYPLVLHAWHAHQGLQALALLELILDCYGEFPNNLTLAQDLWQHEIKPQLHYADFAMFGWAGKQADLSALSVVSPSTAQGSFTKSGSQKINNDTLNTFWLEMYLAFAGFMVSAMPFTTGSDILVYYPLPQNIGFNHLKAITSVYRESTNVHNLYDYSNWMPRAKIDCLSQIGFYESLTQHYLENPKAIEESTESPWEQQIEQNRISGLVGYFYKNISTEIPFDETTFAMPAWLLLDADSQHLKDAKDILNSHRKLIEAIRGEYAEEVSIINAYRRFITLGDADDWIAFTIGYSQHRFNKMVDASWLPPLELSLLEKTLMNNSHKDYRPILATEGFRNIANAIRFCTVRTRWIKDVKKQQTAFKVRHGLGDDLRRRAHNPDHFIEDLAEFIHDYTQESSSVQASTGETRPFITDADIADILALVEHYGSRVVANLLVAVGYASEFQPKSEEN